MNTETRTPVRPVASVPVRGFTGTSRLLRLALRRDRIRIPVWAASIAGIVGVSAESVHGLYGTAQQQAEYVQVTRGNAALIVQSGPGYGLDHPTIGAIFMNETAIWTIILVAVFAILMTTRHTRLEEETARSELVRSAPVGRYAGATAALLAVGVSQVILAATVTAAVIGFGYAPIGAIAFGAALVAAGMAFSAITLVAAQVAASSRAASGLGLMTLGMAFVIRAYGDVAAPWLSWVSPIHWAQAIRAFAGERWLVLVLPVLLTVIFLLAAVTLAEHRDFGSGLLVPRPGRAEAAPTRYPLLALATRLQRGAIIGWAIGIVSGAFFMGTIADQVEKMAAENPAMNDILSVVGNGSITDTYLATGVLIVGFLAAGFAISAVLRMRAEEAAGRVDPLLATPVGRARWAASHLTVTTGALLGMTALGGLAGGLGAALVLNDSSPILPMLGAELTMAAGVAVLGAIAFLVCASLPRWAAAAWVPLVFVAVVGFFGKALDLPSWINDLSPVYHVPALPAASFEAEPVVLLCLVAVSIVTAGFLALPHRDIGRS
jgi:ABC-2 type transport system permease protein